MIKASSAQRLCATLRLWVEDGPGWGGWGRGAKPRPTPYRLQLPLLRLFIAKIYSDAFYEKRAVISKNGGVNTSTTSGQDYPQASQDYPQASQDYPH